MLALKYRPFPISRYARNGHQDEQANDKSSLDPYASTLGSMETWKTRRNKTDLATSDSLPLCLKALQSLKMHHGVFSLSLSGHNSEPANHGLDNGPWHYGGHALDTRNLQQDVRLASTRDYCLR